MFYPTRRAVFLVALGVPLALLSAVLAPKLWLSGLVWVLVATALFLLDALLATISSISNFDLKLPRAVAMGRSERARIALAFSGLTPGTVEFALDVGKPLTVEPLQQASRTRRRRAETEFALHPARRGTGMLERLWIRWRGPLGLSWKQRIEPIAQSVAVVPDIQTVKEEAARLFQRESRQGAHLLNDLGDGSEFHALRTFETGMNLRSIDWKQSARHGLLVSKEYEAENNLHIVFAIDTGRLMCEPVAGQPRLDRAIHAMLLLAFAGLRLGDRIGLFAFGERPTLNSGTISGTGAFQQLQRLAAGLAYSDAETNFTLAFTDLAGTIAHRSIVVVFTDFADTIGAELLLENVARLLARHVVLFVVFRDEELETILKAPPATPDDVSRAVVADTMLKERESVINRLKRMGVTIVDAPLEAIGMGLINAYLELKRSGRV